MWDKILFKLCLRPLRWHIYVFTFKKVHSQKLVMTVVEKRRTTAKRPKKCTHAIAQSVKFVLFCFVNERELFMEQ